MQTGRVWTGEWEKLRGGCGLAGNISRRWWLSSAGLVEERERERSNRFILPFPPLFSIFADRIGLESNRVARSPHRSGS